MTGAAGDREMPVYSHILVAVDGSAESAHALRHALVLAARFGAALRIVHVADMGWLAAGPELAIDTGRFAEARRAAGQRILDDAAALARGTGVDAQTRLLETAAPAQRVAAVIADEAAAWPADLVVLGSHGHGALDRLLLGSVADRLLRICPAPVLLVRGGERGAGA